MINYKFVVIYIIHRFSFLFNFNSWMYNEHLKERRVKESTVRSGVENSEETQKENSLDIRLSSQNID